MVARNRIAAITLASIMAINFVANTSKAATNDAFTPSHDKKLVKMTQSEMVNTKRGFAIRLGTAVGLAGLGVGVFAAGVTLCDATHEIRSIFGGREPASLDRLSRCNGPFAWDKATMLGR